MSVMQLPPEIEALIADDRKHPELNQPRPRRGYAPSLIDWMQALCMQGNLVVEGDETEEELCEAIDYLVESLARR